MKQVTNDFDLQIEDENNEIDVEVNYRCFINESVSLYPMTVYGAIYKGLSLQEFKDEHLKNYEKEYSKVEIIEVYVDLSEIETIAA